MPIFQVKHLNTKYQTLRRTRPDGNCFFRAFTFSYFESLIGDEAEFDRSVSFGSCKCSVSVEVSAVSYHEA